MSSGTINHDTQKPNNVITMAVLIAIMLFFIIVIVGCFYLYKSLLSSDQNEKQDTAKQHVNIQELDRESYLLLHSLKWRDKANGQVQIPIDMAMKHVIKTYNN